MMCSDFLCTLRNKVQTALLDTKNDNNNDLSEISARVSSPFSESKQYAYVSCNRMNLPTSLSIKYQLIVCCRFIVQRGLVKDVQMPALDGLSLSDCEDFQLYSHVVILNVLIQAVELSGLKFRV